jgi:hypothetical protein
LTLLRVKLPGLQSANVFVPDRRLREDLARQYERNLFPQVNVLGMVAAEAAYTHGETWLEELLAYQRANHAHFSEAVNEATTKVRVLPADSLYLAWMDCQELHPFPLATDRPSVRLRWCERQAPGRSAADQVGDVGAARLAQQARRDGRAGAARAVDDDRVAVWHLGEAAGQFGERDMPGAVNAGLSELAGVADVQHHRRPGLCKG